MSGSDDGNLFVWSKDSGKLNGIYEGDGSVVNVIEGHPTLPLVAVSGIDTTVKLFSPVDRPSVFSRMADAENIVQQNVGRDRTGADEFLAVNRQQLAALLRVAALASNTHGGEVPGCPSQ